MRRPPGDRRPPLRIGGLSLTYDGMMQVMVKPSYGCVNRLSSVQLVDLSEYVMESQYPGLIWSNRPSKRWLLSVRRRTFCRHLIIMTPKKGFWGPQNRSCFTLCFSTKKRPTPPS